MATPYIGEIRIVGFNFAPEGWAFCNGSLMAIAQNETLFTLIGTTYGGDGVTTFALPNLQDRVPVHQGTGGGQTLILGESGGESQVTLTSAQLPSHTHTVSGASGGPQVTPVGQTWGDSGQNGSGGAYASPGATNPMSAQALGQAGGGQPHTNLSPYLGLNFIIALFGIFPSQE
ncbi:MAG: phage tail protein [Candidatus Binataceae bacterium]